VSDTHLASREFVGHCAVVSELCLAGVDRKCSGQHNTLHRRSVLPLQLTHYSPPSLSPRVLFVCSSKPCAAAVTTDSRIVRRCVIMPSVAISFMIAISLVFDECDRTV